MRSLLISMTLGLLAATTAGCESDDTPATATGTKAPAAAAPAAPLTDHVAGRADLLGLRVTAAPRDETLARFAAAHEKRVTAFRAAGYRATAESAFGTTRGPSNGFSIAVRMRDAATATREANRLFTSNSAPEPGTRISPLAVPGVARARAVTLSGSDDGRRFTGVEIVWTSGPVLHEIFLVGLAGRVSPGAVARAAGAVAARVTAQRS